MSFVPNPQTDRIGTDGTTDYQFVVTINNDGDASGDRTVTLDRNGTVVDSQNIALTSGESVQLTLTDSAIDDAPTPFDAVYQVTTGNRDPKLNARVVRSYLIDGTTSNPTTVPTKEIGKLRYAQTGRLGLNQNDVIQFHN